MLAPEQVLREFININLQTLLADFSVSSVLNGGEGDYVA